jgi:AraC-like DNA-binding protein
MMLIDDGVTKLGGRNVGKYPKHHFVFNRSFLTKTGWPLKVVSVGDDEWAKGCYRFRENSNLCALEFVQTGNFIFLQQGRKYNVGPDEVFIVHRGLDNEMLTETYSTKKVLIIDGDALRALLTATGLDQLDVIRPENPDRLRELYNKAEAICREANPGFMDAASVVLYEILLELGRGCRNREYPEQLREIIDFMSSCTDRQLTVDEISVKFGMSKAGLHRLFKKNMECSPIEYFIRIKMQIARDLLTVSHHSIKEIALQLGYSNQLYFSAEFKKRVGVSPKTFRLHPAKNTG